MFTYKLIVKKFKLQSLNEMFKKLNLLNYYQLLSRYLSTFFKNLNH